MIDFNAKKFFENALFLRELMEIVHDNEEGNQQITENDCKIYLRTLQEIYDDLLLLEAKIAARACTRLMGNLEDNDEDFTYLSFKKYAEDLELRIRDELENTKVLVLEINKRRFYEPETPIFGVDVQTNYPSAYFEIDEAGKCLALGRSTACVFHLMRVLEVGIAAVAAGLKIPNPTKPAQRNWGYILSEIKKAIDERQRWRKRAHKTFFEEAHATLDSVRNPWRNATMHVEKTYTEEEAENIFFAVRAFMKKIASQIGEKGKFVS